jgi:hypothetical protein
VVSQGLVALVQGSIAVLKLPYVDKLESTLTKLLSSSSLMSTGKSYWRGRLSTIDLLVLTTIDHLPKCKHYLLFYKTSMRSPVLSLPLQQGFPIEPNLFYTRRKGHYEHTYAT